MEYPGLIGGSYMSQAVTADYEDLMNFYVEPLESQGATSKVALYPTPGVTTLDTGTSSPGRAHYYGSSREFAVLGTVFYEVSSGGVLTSRGTVAIDGNPATISSNGDAGGQLFVTSGGNGYVYNLSTDTLTQVTALNGICTMGDHLDGYFLALDSATSKLYISALNDGSSWTTGTDFAQRSIAPDPWKAMKVKDRYIWLLGESTSEIWYDTGDSFPFAPYPSGLIPYGIAAPFSVAVGGGAITWLGASREGDSFVLHASGFTPDTVSNYPIQNTFNGYTTNSDAVGDVYNDLGHTFYLLSFPTENVTWAWDFQTGRWARRGTWVSEENRFVAWRPRWHAHAFGEHRMLDGGGAGIFRMSSTLTTDVDSRVIRRGRRAPTLTAENQRIYYSAIELDMEPGLGTQTGQGYNPQAMLRWSNDGGKTWSAEVWRTAGKAGEYSTRIRWTRLGCARRRTFEWWMTDPIPWKITNAYLELGQAIKGLPGALQGLQ